MGRWDWILGVVRRVQMLMHRHPDSCVLCPSTSTACPLGLLHFHKPDCQTRSYY